MLIATAGHVDHGKTTLIRALTGVNTDRLPEEKSRGLTIDLGFAYHRATAAPDSDNEAVLGFVDVPGHERFVRNMLAGVGAIDIAMLVVAADDGPMPQTVEHLAILGLLDVPDLVVAITRIDLVEPDQLKATKSALIALLEGTHWQQSVQIFEVNALTDTGIDDLRQCLLTRSAVSARRHRGHHFRLAVDRVFTVAGTGTVVTGAVVCGGVSPGDELLLLPAAKPARIRSIHADGRPADIGKAGQRLALNLAGIDRDGVNRGDWLVAPECEHMHDRIHVRLQVLGTESRALRHWTPVHVHCGTDSVTARIALSGARAVAPAQSDFAELRLDRPMHLLFGDRFVVRDQSATRTIGGGTVLHPFSMNRSARQLLLPALSAPEPGQALAALLDSNMDGFAIEQFRVSRNLAAAQLERILQQAGAVVVDGYLFSQQLLSKVESAIIECIDRFHEARPTDIGVEETQLRHDSGNRATPRLFGAVLQALLRDSQIVRDGVRLRRTDFKPALLPAQQGLLERVVAVLGPQALQPPSLSALAQALDEDRLGLVEQLEPLVNGGHIARVAANRYFHPAAIDALSELAKTLASESERGVFDARAFRDAAGIGRNVTIDVLEYLDRIGVTRRLGDGRSIRK